MIVCNEACENYLSENDYTIIGIAGQRRSGKDTLARYMQYHLKQRDKHLTEFALAEPITHAAYGFDLRFRVWDKETALEPHGFSYRTFCRRFGDFMQQECGERVFYEIIEGEISRRDIHSALVTDVRRHYEADWIRGLGGIVVKILRDVEVDDHKTENEVPNIVPDIAIENDEDLNHLYHEAKKLAEYIS